MISALLYLQSRSSWNRLVARLKRLKKPKYLLGLIVGGLYFYLYFIRFAFQAGKRTSAGAAFAATPELLQTLELLGALLLFVLVMSAWIFPRERAALAFSEAEVAFLFPAPVSRRTLIHFKLLRSQFGILFTTLLMALITRRAGQGGNGWIHLAGWWLVFSTLNLHFLAASFTRTRLLDLGVSVWLRRALALGLVIALFAATIAWARQHVPLPSDRDLRNPEAIAHYAQRAIGSGPMPQALLPFRLVVRPYFARNGAEFLHALWPVLGLLALHYLWVIRSNVAFEEASADLARKRAELIGAVRQGRAGVAPPKRKRHPFLLKPTGPPAVALLWKNLIAMGSAFSMRVWIILALVIGTWGFSVQWSLRHKDVMSVIGVVALMSLGMSVLLGPQLLRQDFRRDLRSVDVLKLYPLPGWRVVLGELLAPACVLTGIQWLLLGLAATLLAKFPGGGVLGWSARFSVGCGAAVILPMLNLLSLLIPNAAVLLFPAWFQSGQDNLQGIEATGQRLVFALGQFLVLGLALIPAAIIFAAIFVLARLALPWTVAVPIASLASAVILATEITGGLAALGKVFDRFDLSAEPQS